MMEGRLICYDGRRYALPALLEWRLEYTSGVPCDSFWVKCLWTAGQEDVLAAATRFLAVWEGQAVFQGVVDECECVWSEAGVTLEVSGRGMAALLLDNEAEAADYAVATLGDILNNHVTPYGIQVAKQTALPPVTGFSVASGSSQWQVLYDFACYHGGVAPRFDREGGLVLAGWDKSREICLDDKVPVVRLCCRERRYGVLSEILVRDRVRKTTQRVVNQDFAARGGRCRRVYTMPGRSSYRTMRYDGQFQLDRSAAALRRLELSVAVPFFAWPGDLIYVNWAGWERNGRYRLLESTVRCDREGIRTDLVLGAPDAAV